MTNFSQTAVELFSQGHSCSESVVKAAIETGIIDKNIDTGILMNVSAAFSGAMGTHECLCGAVAGSQMVLGMLFGKTPLTKEFIKQFKEKRKVTCCRVIKGDCANIVQECAMILEGLVSQVRSKV